MMMESYPGQYPGVTEIRVIKEGNPADADCIKVCFVSVFFSLGRIHKTKFHPAVFPDARNRIHVAALASLNDKLSVLSDKLYFLVMGYLIYLAGLLICLMYGIGLDRVYNFIDLISFGFIVVPLLQDGCKISSYLCPQLFSLKYRGTSTAFIMAA